MSKFKVTWTETSTHEKVLTAEELAELLGVSVEEVEEDVEQAQWDADFSLTDALAEYSDESFDGLVREYIEIEEL